MTIIVYSSRSGSSKKYAESFASRMGYGCFSVKDDYDPEEQIVFFGWISGPKIVGLDKVDPKRLRAVAAVSLDENPEFGWNKVKSRNNITVPFYHLRGWIDRKKLNLLQKLLFAFICARYKLKGLDSHTEPLFNAMMNGGSFYDESGLEQLVTLCTER